MTNLINEIKEAKNCKVNNLDLNANTFDNGKSIYSFDLTKSGKLKSNSIKFFATLNSYNNTSY